MNEKKHFLHSLVFPGFFIFLIWFVKFIEFGLEVKFTKLGIFPLKAEGLIGIITAPLVHADINHLFDNSIPLFFLSLAIFYFYREVSYKVFFLAYFSTGLLVWLVARDAYHIGASGLIYSFATFLFVSGILRRNRNLLSISLLVTFMYGSMVWGLFPFDYKVSWESHLMGAITGFFLAIVYRHKGPEPDIIQWPDDDEEEQEELYPTPDQENDTDYPETFEKKDRVN